jgi:hypothetical protein
MALPSGELVVTCRPDKGAPPYDIVIGTDLLTSIGDVRFVVG